MMDLYFDINGDQINQVAEYLGMQGGQLQQAIGSAITGFLPAMSAVPVAYLMSSLGGLV